MPNKFEATQAEAAKWKPAGYDDLVGRSMDYITGRQKKWLDGILSKRFKKSFSQMSPLPMPFYRHLIGQRANIYKTAPAREVLSASGIDEQATKVINKIYSDANADQILQEIETMAEACFVGFGRVGYDGGKLRLSPFRPDAVNVIFDPEHPSDLQRAKSLHAEITSSAGVAPKKEDKLYEVWTRDGAESWTREVVNAAGDIVDRDSNAYKALPWFAMTIRIPHGSLFEAPRTDDLDVNDSISVMYSQLLHTIAHQMFTQVTHTGEALDPEIEVGLGSILQSENGEWGSLNYTPQIDAVRATGDELMKRLLVLEGVSPVAVSTDPKYMSGAAQKISQQPMLEQRQKKIPALRVLEAQLFHIILKTYPWGPKEGIPQDSVLRWTPGKLDVPTDDTEALTLAEKRVNLGVSEWPVEMVKLGLAPNLDAAAEIFKRISLKNKVASDGVQTSGADASNQQASVQPLDDK